MTSLSSPLDSITAEDYINEAFTSLGFKRGCIQINETGKPSICIPEEIYKHLSIQLAEANRRLMSQSVFIVVNKDEACLTISPCLTRADAFNKCKEIVENLTDHSLVSLGLTEDNEDFWTYCHEGDGAAPSLAIYETGFDEEINI